MAYLGNIKGPRESEILNKLGYVYFGCSPQALEEDISYHRLAESRGEIMPVHVDEMGNPYIEFSIKTLDQPIRFFLDEHGYTLTGNIKTFTENELQFWQKKK